jgi:hypothetical protein
MSNSSDKLVMTGSNQSSGNLVPVSGGVFTGIQQFENAQRIGKALASSALVPKEYQGQQGLANTLVAMEIAQRMGLSPLQVMQNLHIIHGRPSWSSQFIIAMINGCGRFSPLDYHISGEGDGLSCYAYATELATGKELKGPTVTMAMAKREGWATKTGSKWQTMPDLMVRYRAAAFWGRLYVPEFLVGMKTQEEVIDIEPVEVRDQSAVVTELNQKITNESETGETSDDAVW